jgi:ABC transport system ATP-binding/permease protein
VSSGTPIVTIEGLSIAYRGPHLLDDVSCRIFSGERIGLLGRNGAGKTTFMRLLCGQETPDHGRIELADGARIALLPQDVPDEISGTVEEIISQGFLAEWKSAEHAWRAEHRLAQLAAPMQLELGADFRKLSTGMQRRVLLARAIACSPDVLLLDEPTNHLDIDSIVWLEKFLSSLPGTLIFVTHDRRFLTQLAGRILEVDRGRLFDWSCDYPTFLERKEAALAAEDRQNALFDKKLAEEEVWIRQGIKARRTRNEGRVRALESLRLERAARQNKVGSVRIQIETGDRSGALVLKTDNASFGYDGKAIVTGVTTTIMRGDKIGILGPNGVGKSTLLKGLLGQLPAMSGSVRLGTNLEIAYFDQTRAQLDPDQTAEQNVGEGKTTITIGNRSRHVIGYLQDFLFTPEQARSPIRFFSGGQRNRLMLAKMFSRTANLLVLDEPTNDLDSETLELLEANLVEYGGTVLLISHDREFLNNVVGSTLVFENGNVREYVGGYDDWKRQSEKASLNAEKNVAGAGGNSKQPEKNSSTAFTGLAQKSAKLSFKEQRELSLLPELIEKLEAEQSELHASMATEAFYRQPPDMISQMTTRSAEIAEEIQKAYQRWEALT